MKSFVDRNHWANTEKIEANCKRIDVQNGKFTCVVKVYETGTIQVQGVESKLREALLEAQKAIENGESYRIRQSWRTTSVSLVPPAWEDARAAAGIPYIRLHDLRHEAASRLFEKGLNVMEAASVTGHKTLSMLKRYTHLNPTDIAKKLG